MSFSVLAGAVVGDPVWAQDGTTPPPAPAAVGAAPAAQAQTPSPPPPPEAPARVSDVTVTARPSDVRTSIEATSYSVGQDLQSATGTLADALRNIPSVDVDPQGNVALRGDPNVTILVDGRPAAILSGPNRSQALLQLPADQYARIEVMTNPSAAFRPDGSGGVINLITRPARPRAGTGRSGSVRANVGSEERYNLGGNIAHTHGGLTVTGDLGLRHDGLPQRTTRFRERLNASTGLFDASRLTQLSDGHNDSVLARFGVEYQLNERTRLTGDLRHNRSDSEAAADELYEARDGVGSWTPVYERLGGRVAATRASGVTARILHRFDSEGHEWSHELRYDRTRGRVGHDSTTSFADTAAPPVFERLDYVSETTPFGFTSAYVRPLSGGGQLRAGYELDDTDIIQDNAVFRGVSAGAAILDPAVSNRFDVDQTIHALYATWERPFGPLSAQLGLRLEQTSTDIDQVTSGIRRSDAYFRAYPTLHLSYELAEGQALRASYSRRVQRPQPSDLNPFLTYQDPLNLRSGNPDLKPQVTDSFEAGWQRRAGQTFYQATLYHRDTRDAFTNVASDVGGGILLTRPENLGARTATGLELTANGPLQPTLRYSASVNLYHQRIDAAGLPGAIGRSGTTASGRLTLSWQPTDRDFIQVSGLWSGESLNAQGVRTGTPLYNLGYRRKLTETLALQATVRDLLDDFGEVVTYETPTLRDQAERLFGGRIVFIGLTWTFGQGQRRPEQFDFSTPSAN